MHKIEYKGIWFLPENEENTSEYVSGTLVFDRDNGADLELIGVLEDFNPERRDIEFILGITTTGEKITLFESFEYSRTMSIPGLATSKFKSNYIIIGKYIKTIDDLNFTGISATFNNLDNWLNKYGFNEMNNNFKDKISLKYELPKPIEFKIRDDLKGEIVFSYQAPLIYNTKSITINQNSRVNFKSTRRKSFKELFGDLKYFQDFLTLGLFESTIPTEIFLLQKDDEPLTFLYQPSHKNIGNINKRVSDLFFSYLDLEDNFELIMSNWFRLKEKMDTITYILLDGFYNKDISFNENKFLNTIQALESYHRKFKNNEDIPQEEYKKNKQEVLNSIPLIHKNWIQTALHFGNEPTLHNRLKDLLNSFSLETVDKIIIDKEKFIRDSKNSRNYYTHYDQSTEKKALKGLNLLRLTEKLRIILIVVVLKETGFSENQINSLLKRIEWRHFNHLITSNSK